jgi:regulator of sigma E protease
VLTLAAFLVTLGLLIVVHEYGHYLAARLCGVKVLCFSIGFGKPLLKRHIGKDKTELVLAAFPLGGFVRMLDEREAPVAEYELARTFNRQPVARRMAIVAAGPVFNLLLAVLFYWVLFMSGITGMKPILGNTHPGSVAEQASLKSGELIRRVDGVAVATWQDVRWALLKVSLKSHFAEIETSSGNNEIHLHQLDLSVLGGDDMERDILDKLGLVAYRPSVPAQIGEILPGGIAERAGLHTGDKILSVNGIAIGQWEDFVSVVRQNPGKRITLQITRAGQSQEVALTPEVATEGGKTIGRIGAAYRMDAAQLDRLVTEVRYPPLAALQHAAAKTWDTSIFSLRMLGNMITGAVSWKGVSGPVTIASYAGQSAHMGWKAFTTFLALVSISLGVLNLLPVPVLDGGHLMYYVVELIKGSPVSERAMEIGQKIGFALLGLLMACALYNDLNRIITG